jgi:hypothetical protein
MIYRLRFDRFRYLTADISRRDIAEKHGDPFILDSRECWGDIWKPLNIVFHDDSENNDVAKPPDITLWFTSEIICNTKAYEILNSELSEYGEWLPVSCEGIPYWLLHVTKKTGMEAIDQSKSSRTVDETGYPDIQALSFVEEEISDLLIFKSEYSDFDNIYCTERFRTLVKESGLNGLLFSEDLEQQLEP